MGAQWSQFFPPKPSFTDADITSLDGKVFIATGGASGIGFEVVKKLYAKNASVYIARPVSRQSSGSHTNHLLFHSYVYSES